MEVIEILEKPISEQMMYEILPITDIFPYIICSLDVSNEDVIIKFNYYLTSRPESKPPIKYLIRINTFNEFSNEYRSWIYTNICGLPEDGLKLLKKISELKAFY